MPILCPFYQTCCEPRIQAFGASQPFHNAMPQSVARKRSLPSVPTKLFQLSQLLDRVNKAASSTKLVLCRQRCTVHLLWWLRSRTVLPPLRPRTYGCLTSSRRGGGKPGLGLCSYLCSLTFYGGLLLTVGVLAGRIILRSCLAGRCGCAVAWPSL